MPVPTRPRPVVTLTLSALALAVFLGGAFLLARWRLVLVPLAMATVWALDRLRRWR